MGDEIHPEALKLYKSIAKVSNADAAYKTAFGYQLPLVPTAAERKSWTARSMRVLERNFNLDEIRAIRQGCHCGRGMTTLHRQLLGCAAGTRTLPEFAEALHGATGEGWYCKEGALYRRRTVCTCPMVEDIRQLPGRGWCCCAEGYYKALFGRTLGCEINAELLQSLKTGDDACLVRITPRGQPDFSW